MKLHVKADAIMKKNNLLTAYGVSVGKLLYRVTLISSGLKVGEPFTQH